MVLALVLIPLSMLIVIWVAIGLRAVHPEHRAVIERFGRYRKTAGPGLRVTLPFVHTRRLVDMREQVEDVSTDALTSDKVTVSVHVTLFYACADPRRLLYDVADLPLAFVRVTETQVRSMVARLTLGELLGQANELAEQLRLELEMAAAAWGVQVNCVEIPRIDPPDDVVDAMNEKAAAEWVRETHAVKAELEVRTTTAKGEAERFERIREAEASRQVSILRAEAEAGATRVLADADRYRQQALADAQADAIRTVTAAIQEGWAEAEMTAVRYLGVTGQGSSGQAMRVILPMQGTGMLGPLAGVVELSEGLTPRPAESAAVADLTEPSLWNGSGPDHS